MFTHACAQIACKSTTFFSNTQILSKKAIILTPLIWYCFAILRNTIKKKAVSRRLFFQGISLFIFKVQKRLCRFLNPLQRYCFFPFSARANLCCATRFGAFLFQNMFKNIFCRLPNGLFSSFLEKNVLCLSSFQFDNF